MLEAKARGHSLLVYTPDKLSMRDGKVSAGMRPVEIRDVVGDHVTAGEERRVDLLDTQVVLMRQDPPFDMAYITATHLLERVHPKSFVVNDPASVRNAPEKIFVTEFPGPHAADPDHPRQEGDRSLPQGAWRDRHEAAARAWRGLGVQGRS